jgi:Rrf2 family protein
LECASLLATLRYDAKRTRKCIAASFDRSLLFRTVKITVKLEYACRIMCELARQYADARPVSIDELSKVEAVPANFLAQILGELKNGRLVVSRRGVQGGFMLARAPDTISLADIISVIEGGIIELSGNHEGRSGRRLKRAWTEIGAAAEDKAASFTLDVLANTVEADMYYI